MSEKIYGRDYYGFVYIWFDRYRKMFYIGSHMGPVDLVGRKRYICSSKWMLRAYKARPSHFIRRIVYWHLIQDDAPLRDIETRWLRLIREKELRTRYYNLKRDGKGRSSQGQKHTEETKRAISEIKRRAFQDPEYRQKMLEVMAAGRTDVTRRKQRTSLKKTWERSEFLEKMSRKFRAVPAHKRSHPGCMTGMVFWNDGASNTRARSCPGEGWVRGRIICQKPGEQSPSRQTGCWP